MKKNILLSIATVLMMMSISSMNAFAQPPKEKNKTEHGKGKDKGQPPLDNHGNPPRDLYMGEEPDLGAGDGHGKGNKGKSGEQGVPGKSGVAHASNDKDEVKDDHGNKVNVVVQDEFAGNTTSFKNKMKERSNEKVTLCHKTGNDDGVTISVSAMALQAHLAHGDTRGECPTVAKVRYSNTYIQRRKDYYDRLAIAEEKVMYSRSLLEYSRKRLANAKLQLAEMRRRKMRQEDLAVREQTVLQLEQNTTLLETLVGTATNLLVNKIL